MGGKASPGLENLAPEIWRGIAEEATDYFIVIDLEYRIIHCSRIEPGFTWEELVNQSVFLFLAEKDHERIRIKYDRVRESKKPQRYRTEVDLRDQGIRHFDTRVLPYFEHECMVGLILYIRDRTEGAEVDQLILNSENRYRNLFEFSPVPLWEENFSELRTYLEDLRKQGVIDFTEYFKENQQAVIDCVKRVRIVDINQATLRMLKAGTKRELIETLDQVLGEESMRSFEEQLAALGNGARSIFLESVNYALDGTPVFVEVYFTIPPHEEKTWSRVIVSTLDISRRKQAEEKVELYQRNLRQMSSELSSAEDRERRKIATRLHDDVGQMLALSRLKIGRIAQRVESVDGQSYADSRELDKILKDIIVNVRSLTFELSSPLLYEVGFEAALRDMIEQLESGYDIKSTLKLAGMDREFSEPLRGLLYRLSRELILNVVKHAEATHIQITTYQENANYFIEVCDDGTGFDYTKARQVSGLGSGFGLFSIQEQLEHIGGSIAVESHTGQGTKIVLQVPI